MELLRISTRNDFRLSFRNNYSCGTSVNELASFTKDKEKQFHILIHFQKPTVGWISIKAKHKLKIVILVLVQDLIIRVYAVTEILHLEHQHSCRNLNENSKVSFDHFFRWVRVLIIYPFSERVRTDSDFSELKHFSVFGLFNNILDIYKKMHINWRGWNLMCLNDWDNLAAYEIKSWKKISEVNFYPYFCFSETIR